MARPGRKTPTITVKAVGKPGMFLAQSVARLLYARNAASALNKAPGCVS